MDFSALSQWRRAAYCTAMAQRNQNHILLFCEMTESDPKPFNKLLTKTWAFIEGELKSVSNLERFFAEFESWQEALLKDQDSFGAEAAQQACQSLASATYGMLDESADDCELVQLSMKQLFESMAETGADVDELIERQTAFEEQCFSMLSDNGSRKETVIAIRKLASSENESSLGIALD